MPGKFVVKKGPTGKFRFNLVSSNGQVIATSEAYETKRSAMAGIKSVQKVAMESMVEDQTTKEWAEQAAASKAAAKAKKAGKKAKAAARSASPRKKAAASTASSDSGSSGGGDTSSSS